jgi:NADPH:quinone reductase-like Zn-dependent oxidoreductase
MNPQAATMPPGTSSSHPESMKAWLYTPTSSPLEETLRNTPSTRTPLPPKGNEVFIRVLSAALNPLDYKFPSMGLPFRLLLGNPVSPGLDFCGRVVASGPLAQHFTEGQLVHGAHPYPTQFGSLGEYVCLAADNIVAVPDGVAVDHAAALPVAGLTAMQSLEGRVKAGERVLVIGGSGGCGTFVIQIAKNMGAHVTVVCSARNMELCLRYGADEAVDYVGESDLVGKLEGRGVVFDLVVDLVGDERLYYGCHRFSREGGVFVLVGVAGLLSLATRLLWPAFLGGGKREIVFVMVKNDMRQLGMLGEWVAEGRIQVQVDGIYEFQDAVKAFERLRSGRARGKIIVHVNDPNEHSMEAFGIGL